MKNIKGFILFLLLSLPIVSFAADKFFCSGNKPIWNLSIASDKIIFRKESATPIVVPGVTAKPAQNTTIEEARVYRSKTAEDKATIIIKKGACTDGNKKFKYGVLSLIDGYIYHGCCIKR